MRYTEFWTRLEAALGPEARSWAELCVMPELGSRTTREAFQAGMEPKEVWAVVRRTLELPESTR